VEGPAEAEERRTEKKEQSYTEDTEIGAQRTRRRLESRADFLPANIAVENRIGTVRGAARQCILISLWRDKKARMLLA